MFVCGCVYCVYICNMYTCVYVCKFAMNLLHMVVAGRTITIIYCIAGIFWGLWFLRISNLILEVMHLDFSIITLTVAHILQCSSHLHSCYSNFSVYLSLLFRCTPLILNDHVQQHICIYVHVEITMWYTTLFHSSSSNKSTLNQKVLKADFHGCSLTGIYCMISIS